MYSIKKCRMQNDYSHNIFFTHDSYDNVDIYYHWLFYISANEITMILVTI